MTTEYFHYRSTTIYIDDYKKLTNNEYLSDPILQFYQE